MTEREQLEKEIAEAAAKLEAVELELEEVAEELDEIECEPVDEPYSWAETKEQKCRHFIIQNYLDPTIDVYILLESMQHIYDWAVSGVVPTRPKANKVHLRAVSSE